MEQNTKTTTTKKLRLLCLHGLDTTKEIFKWQLRTFYETYGDLIDLTFIDAPHETGRKRFQVFADRGFKGPYRKWLELDRDVFYKTMDKFDIP